MIKSVSMLLVNDGIGSQPDREVSTTHPVWSLATPPLFRRSPCRCSLRAVATR